MLTVDKICDRKSRRNCDDYARIVKGSLQNLNFILNSVKTA
ncbi:hypothetical protein FDUTEX481_10049 [Tolypothrix sp. PCC 7601]|nr:hypothetical protein [Tolypothrix sp. PCC 7712]EKE99473.1 hypothetical protein FDUTEX481_10049 [Tolypothrix sp. PCC 7601]